MPVQRSPGFQNAKASGYIPEIWAKDWNYKFYCRTIASSITNTKYEGQLQKMGDKVIIPTIPEIEWTQYHKGQKLEITGKLESDPITMTVDRAHYFKFVQDDVDKAQSYVDAVRAALADSAKKGAIRIDRQLLCDLPYHVDPCNQGNEAGCQSGAFDLGSSFGIGTGPRVLTCGGTDCSNDALNLLLDMMTVLEESDVVGGDDNLSGFFYVIPPFFKNLVLKHPRFQDASAMGDSSSPLRNGKVGMIDGAEVFCTTNLPFDEEDDGNGNKVKVWKILAGHKMATTFASQLTRKDYGMRSEQTFGDIYRQLQVYDWKVTNPEALALAKVVKG